MPLLCLKIAEKEKYSDSSAPTAYGCLQIIDASINPTQYPSTVSKQLVPMLAEAACSFCCCLFVLGGVCIF